MERSKVMGTQMSMCPTNRSSCCHTLLYSLDKKSYTANFSVQTGQDIRIQLMGANRKWPWRFRMAPEFLTFDSNF